MEQALRARKQMIATVCVDRPEESVLHMPWSIAEQRLEPGFEVSLMFGVREDLAGDIDRSFCECARGEGVVGVLLGADAAQDEGEVSGLRVNGGVRDVDA